MSASVPEPDDVATLFGRLLDHIEAGHMDASHPRAVALLRRLQGVELAMRLLSRRWTNSK